MILSSKNFKMEIDYKLPNPMLIQFIIHGHFQFDESTIVLIA